MKDQGKVLQFNKVNIEPPASDVQELLCDASSDTDFTSAVVLLQDKDGYWHFRCTRGIEKVPLIGMLEFMKMDLFTSMSPMEDM